MLLLLSIRTSAILVPIALEIEKGDEIISLNTFVASSNVTLH